MTFTAVVRSRPTLPALGLLAVLMAGPAEAYWEVVPDVHTGITYESNPRNRATMEEDATGAFIDVRLPTAWKTAAGDLTLVPRARFTEYSGSSNDDLDSDNYYVNLNYTRKGVRQQWGISSNYENTDVRSSEFFSATPEDPDVDPPPDGGFGRFIFPDDRRRSWGISPFWQAVLTERNTIDITFSTSDTKYDQEIVETYFDYTYQSGQVRVSHSLDLQSAFTLTVSGTRFDAEQPEHPLLPQGPTSTNVTDTRSFFIGYRRTITPTLSAEMNLGTSRSTVRLDGPYWTDPDTFLPCLGLPCRTTDENFVGDLSVRKRSELTTMNFGISRSTAPRSNGTEVVRDTANFFVERRMTRQLVTSVGVIYTDESALGEAARQDRNYFSADLNARWQFARAWWLYGTYTFRSDEYDITHLGITDDSKRENNRVIIGIQYRDIGFRW